MTGPNLFPQLLQRFFTDRLLHQRGASPHTIASYRDAFRLLLRFAQQRLGKDPAALALDDLDARFLGEFLDHVEHERGNTARTRNVRLAAMHAFFRYVSICEPAHAERCRRILGIPAKRHRQRPIAFLARDEINAVLAAPDATTWIGRRDRTLLLVAIQTGLRVSELTHLRRQDVILGVGAHLRCDGKGRKQRCTPLRRDAAAAVAAWLRECQPEPHEAIFPSARGEPLSRDAVERIVSKYAHLAQRACPSLARKHVTPHVLRHTTAMELLQHGIDRSVIALWLGHESVETTQMYLHADLRLKEQALSRTRPVAITHKRYQPGDRLLAFLEGL
jgi:integrase/recombinase XerD